MELTEKELGILGREIFFATMSLASSSKHVSVVKKRCRINGNLFTDVEFTPQM